MPITNYALEMMGFEPIPEDSPIEANFMSINIYQIRGINFSPDTPVVPEVKEVSKSLSFAIGDSLNAVCKVIIGDDFTENEEKWRLETKSSPPYLVVLTKLDEPAVCEKGYWKHEGDEIITHDCFAEVKRLLTKQENKTVSVLIISLSVTFSTMDHPVLFLPIHKEMFAETNFKKRLRDFQITCSGDISVSRALTADAITAKINTAIARYQDFHPKIGYFFDLAIRENDKLKAFIYIFLVIEIFTHNTFQKLEYRTIVPDIHMLPSRVEKSATEFFIERQKEAKNLLQRFIWCSIIEWDQLADSDIELFKSIKKVRDRIYHGEDVVESSLPIWEAKLLALKLLQKHE